MDLRLVDTSALSELEQMQLAPFYLAYHPHGPIPSRAVLKVEGEGTYFPSHNEKTMDLIKEQARMMDRMYYGFIETTTRDVATGGVRDMTEEDEGYDEECCMSGAVEGEVFDDE